MATNEPKTLQEYLTWVVAEIDNGKPVNTAHEIGRFMEFRSGQDYVNDNPQKALAPLAATDPEESKELLRQFFKSAEVVVVYPTKPESAEAKNLTQFNEPVAEKARELPTLKHPSEKIPSLIQALNERTDQRVAQVRKDVQDYFARVREQGLEPPQNLETVVSEVYQPVYEETISGVKEVLNERAETLTPELRQTVTTLSQDPSVLRDVMAASEVIAGAAALNENVTITRPKDVRDLIAAVPKDAVTSGHIDPSAVEQTIEYAKTKTLVGAQTKDYSGVNLGDLVHGPMAPLANIFSALPGVKDEALRRALENALNNTIGELQTALGANIVNDPKFQLILRSAQNAVQQKAGARTFFGGLGRFFGYLI